MKIKLSNRIFIITFFCYLLFVTLNINYEVGNYYKNSIVRSVDKVTFLSSSNEYVNYDSSLSYYTEEHGKDILKNITLGSTFSQIRNMISTNGNVSFIDNSGNVITDGETKVKTGDKFVIDFLESGNKYYIHLSVSGDVTGDGKIDIDDVNEAYDILKKEKNVEKYYELAGNVIGDEILKINDVAKLYQYIKKKAGNLDEIDEEDKIHFIAVGSSDAFLIESNGKYGLVDSSNPNDDSSQAVGNSNQNVSKVIEYLEEIGVEKLDFIIATHSHSDHIGGMPMIANGNFVDENTKYYYRMYVETKEDTTHPEWENKNYYEKAVDAMKSKNVEMIEVTNQSPIFTFGDFNIYLFNTDSGSFEDGENYNSIGTLITKGDTRIFLSADIELVDSNKVITYLKEVDVLKLNHHGYSGFNNNYFSYLNPKTIIVSNNKLLDSFKPFSSNLISKGIDIYFTGDEIDAIKLKVEDDGYLIEDNVHRYDTILSGWQQISNKWYYFNTDGSMVIGWCELEWSNGKDWFYFDDDGIMLRGWQKLEWNGVENWYYFDENGAMMSDVCKIIDNTNYCFDISGVCTTGCL